ncbi:MAG: hypothetical protein P8J32_05390 [bacterium]|jgi:hypothetical protein|nr:hypothetical protein [bacterium]
MQKLNIPLHKHTRATRRTRRVVWLPVIAVLVGLFLASRFGVLWFSRGTILAAAPAETVAALHLQNSKKAAPLLQSYFHGIPLISNRSLTIEELLRWTEGELAVFLQADGSRSVALRTDETNLPENLFDSYGISIQEHGSFVLLSESLLPVVGLEMTSPVPFLPSLGKTWLGQVILPESGSKTSIFHTHSGLLLITDTEKQQVPDDLAADTELSLALQSLPMTLVEDDVPGLDRLSRAFFKDSQENASFLGFDQDSIQLFLSGEDTNDVLLTFDGQAMTKEALLKQLQLLGAFGRPLLVEIELPDETSYQELQIRPDLISVEEFSLMGNVAYRVSTNTNQDVVAVVQDHQLLLANSTKIVEAYLSPEVEETECSGNLGFLSPAHLLREVQSVHIEPSLAALYPFFSQFSLITFENEKYSTEIRLCL